MSFTNFVSIDGNLVRDGDVRYSAAGNCVVSFSVAHNTKRDNKDEVHYFDCAAVGKYAEMIIPSLSKGASVLIVGRLNQRRWEKDGAKRSAIQIFATQVMFSPPKPSIPETEARLPDDDDIPF